MPLDTQLKMTQGLLFKHFQVNSNGSIQHIAPAKVERMGGQGKPDYSNTKEVVESHVKNNKYLSLADFDDHFADVSQDWRNEELN